jgi:hypothetical protein
VLYSVAYTLLLAICLECFVKNDRALGSAPIEGESEEDLRWNPLKHEPGKVVKPKPLVVIRMPHNAASRSAKILQP